MRQYSAYQRGFVDQAVKLLKRGGRLAYSTCTYNPEENEGMVKYVLEKYRGMELVDVGVELGKRGVDGCGLTDEQRGMVRRFNWCGGGEEQRWPKADCSIGFFVALFVKKEEDEKEET